MVSRKRSRKCRAQRRKEAEERQADRENRPDAQQLISLESRGFGGCQEAERLRTELDKSQEV